ncbi:hypothetical protein ACFE04_020785 [Oxalis oulophora]
MADALSVIPTAVLGNLSDKLYEKHKNAALEGGLIGLAAITVGLTSEASQHLEIVFGLICQQIVPPVLNSFSDQDGRVRYYACEALYNITKVVRGEFIVFGRRAYI